MSDSGAEIWPTRLSGIYNKAAAVTNPCFYAAWTLGAAPVGTAAVKAPEVKTTVSEEYPSLFHRVLTWLQGLRPRGGTISAATTAAKAAWGDINSTCSQLQ